MSSFDPSVAETRSTLPLPKFFMESPDWLEHIQEPVKTLSLCSNSEAQSRVGQRLQPAKPAASAIVARHTKPSIEKRACAKRATFHTAVSRPPQTVGKTKVTLSPAHDATPPPQHFDRLHGAGTRSARFGLIYVACWRSPQVFLLARPKF